MLGIPLWWRHAGDSPVVELWGGFHCAVVGAGLGGREVCFYRCSTVVVFPGCVLISPSIIRATTQLYTTLLYTRKPYTTPLYTTQPYTTKLYTTPHLTPHHHTTQRLFRQSAGD